MPLTGLVTAAVLATRGTINPLLAETTSRAPSGVVVPTPTCAMPAKLAATSATDTSIFFMVFVF